MRRYPPLWLFLGLLALSACGSRAPGGVSYVGGSVPIECAPFARALSGVRLTGPAADWWREADGRYTRSDTPAVGSVLVFRRSARLPEGHVAVVSRLVAEREIMVTQANWVHHRVSTDQTVIDVSPAGDWSVVRVWWPPSEQMGTTGYTTFGFIRAARPLDHDRLIATTPRAIRVAIDGG